MIQCFKLFLNALVVALFAFLGGGLYAYWTNQTSYSEKSALHIYASSEFLRFTELMSVWEKVFQRKVHIHSFKDIEEIHAALITHDRPVDIVFSDFKIAKRLHELDLLSSMPWTLGDNIEKDLIAQQHGGDFFFIPLIWNVDVYLSNKILQHGFSLKGQRLEQYDKQCLLPKNKDFVVKTNIKWAQHITSSDKKTQFYLKEGKSLIRQYGISLSSKSRAPQHIMRQLAGLLSSDLIQLILVSTPYESSLRGSTNLIRQLPLQLLALETIELL